MIFYLKSTLTMKYYFANVWIFNVYQAANMDTSEEEAEDDFIDDGSEESVKSGSGSGSESQ